MRATAKNPADYTVVGDFLTHEPYGIMIRKDDAPLKKLAADVGCAPAQLALAWLLAQPGVVTIPKSSTRERVKENFGALDVKLSPDVMAALDKAFPSPRSKQSLQML